LWVALGFLNTDAPSGLKVQLELLKLYVLFLIHSKFYDRALYPKMVHGPFFHKISNLSRNLSFYYV